MTRNRSEPSTAQIALGLAALAAACAIVAWVAIIAIGSLGGSSPTSQPQRKPPRATAEATASSSRSSASVRPAPAPVLQVRRAMRHVGVLANTIGVRREGTDGERRAGAYIARQLAESGYPVRYQAVDLPDGRRSRNVYAVKKGISPLRIVLGAHYDSKSPSPGANDNGTGVGIVLELARVLKRRRLAPTIVFVFFGAEEMIGRDGNQHHFGSRAFVERMGRARRAQVAGMISVDMVGAGDEFLIRTMGRGPTAMSDAFRAVADQEGVPLTYRRDPGETGWSDHEPFELAGIPAAWIEWVKDPVYHTPGDTPDHIQPSRMRATGRLLQRFIETTKMGRLRRLAASNTN